MPKQDYIKALYKNVTGGVALRPVLINPYNPSDPASDHILFGLGETMATDDDIKLTYSENRFRTAHQVRLFYSVNGAQRPYGGSLLLTALQAESRDINFPLSELKYSFGKKVHYELVGKMIYESNSAMRTAVVVPYASPRCSSHEVALAIVRGLQVERERYGPDLRVLIFGDKNIPTCYEALQERYTYRHGTRLNLFGWELLRDYFALESFYEPHQLVDMVDASGNTVQMREAMNGLDVPMANRYMTWRIHNPSVLRATNNSGSDSTHHEYEAVFYPNRDVHYVA